MWDTAMIQDNMTENEDDERDGDAKHYKHMTSSRYLRKRTGTTPQKSIFTKGDKSLETFSLPDSSLRPNVHERFDWTVSVT